MTTRTAQTTVDEHDSAKRRPLTGVRVLDFTWVRAGPWSTRWLAALGADVIKVEWPGTDTFSTFSLRGAPGNANPGFGVPAGAPAGYNSGGQFNDTNAGKRGITLNVRDPRGLEYAKRLIAQADIVIENFSSHVMENWGIGYDTMVGIKPDLIYISMAGLGQVGRDREYVTMGPVVQALSGLTFSSGLPEHPPAGWGWSYMDDTGGMYAAISSLTALHHRNVTGQGQHIDLSQVAAAITLTGPVLLDYVLHGRGSRREGYPPGNRAVWPGAPIENNYRGPIVAPHNTYRTAGGGYNDWCAIVCNTDAEWQQLVEVMGAPAWAASAEFATNAGRIEHQQQVDAGIEAWAQTLGKYEIMRRCQAAGVRAMPVQSNQDRVDHDEQLRYQQMYRPLFHPVLGTNLVQNFPFTLSETNISVTGPAPLIGQHNREILGSLLNVSDEEIRTGQEQGLFWPSNVARPPYLDEAFDAPLVTTPAAEHPSLVDVGRSQRFAAGPLGDLRVLELADEQGQWCGKLLADLGADVIKIEPPGGSSERAIGPFYEDVPDPDRSLRFWHYNTSKRGITLDLEASDDRALFLELVASADVVLETRAPGYLASLGLSYDELKAINPRLVMCSLTDFGQSGPWSGYKGADLVHLAAGGQMSACGYTDTDFPDAPPIAPGGGNTWHIGSHYATIAIMAAVNHRDYTGIGQYIDASVHGACALTTEGHVPMWIYRKEVFKRRTGGNGAQHAASLATYINFGGLQFTPARLQDMISWMDEYGLADDLTDPRYIDQFVINESLDHIMDVVRNFFANMKQEDIYRGAQARRFPTGAVRAAEDNLEDPHWQDRGFWPAIEHPELNRAITYPGAAAIYSATPWRISRRAPMLGEHNDEVRQELRSMR